MNVMSQKEYISLLSRHLFWDMDVNKVNLDTCPAQIIQRLSLIHISEPTRH